MENNNLFEIATRRHFRFPSPVGVLSTEDLWGLALTSTKANVPNLNAIAQAINFELGKVDGIVDFVNPGSSKGSTLATELGLKLDVVKAVIAHEVGILERSKKAADTKAHNEKIQELIAKKKENALGDLTVEELTKMLS